MEKVRVGVIGIGNMGSAHAESILSGEINGLELTAVCDIDEVKFEKFKNRNNRIKFYADYHSLISGGEADAVIIAVPHPLHADIAQEALKGGLHVLVEKPADVTVSKVRKLNDIAAATSKVFAIMFNQRTNPLFQRAREIVKSGQLGELKRTVWIVTNWYRTQRYYDSGEWRATWSGEGGGVLLNQAPHNLDLWQWICGMPKNVVGFCDIAKYHKIEVEDDVTIFARYQNGATGTFITTTGEYPGTNRLEVSGDLGKIVLEDGVLKWWKLKAAEHIVRENADTGFAKIDYEYSEIKQEGPEPAHRGILQNFANSILYGEELIAPGSDGIYELQISNAAYLSSFNNNSPVEIPFDEKEFDRLLEHLVHGSHIPQKGHSNEKMGRGYDPRWMVNW